MFWWQKHIWLELRFYTVCYEAIQHECEVAKKRKGTAFFHGSPFFWTKKKLEMGRAKKSTSPSWAQALVKKLG